MPGVGTPRDRWDAVGDVRVGGPRCAPHYTNLSGYALMVLACIFRRNEISMVMESVIFPFEADQLALDFLNAGLEPGPGPGPERVAAWLHQAGLATEADVRCLAASPPLTRILLTEAFALRDGVGDAVAAFQRGALLPEHALFALNRVLGTRSTSLRVDPRGVAAALAQVEEARFPEGLLAPVAAAAAELLAHGDRSRLRRCSADGCGRWFYDVSRNGRRRWCSMARCGNRAKVAAHYRRHRGALADVS